MNQEINKEVINSLGCRVKRSYPVCNENYDPKSCGDREAGSFVDTCPTCKKSV